MSRLATIAVALLSILCSHALAQTPSRAIRYYQVPTGNNTTITITVELISMLSPKPTVGVLLIPGGRGIVGYNTSAQPAPEQNMAGEINKDSLVKNFLVKNRDAFAQKGLMVAVVDFQPGGVTPEFRLSAAHAGYLSKLIELIRKEPGYEVSRLWVVGTSTGSLSAANVAARYPLQTYNSNPDAPNAPDPNVGRPNGVVLTSTLTVHDMKCASGQSRLDDSKIIDDVAGLTAANVPAYAIWNTTDQCVCSPGTGPGTQNLAQAVISKFSKSTFNGPKRVAKPFSGAGSTGDQCSGVTAHGFWNNADEVVTYIVNSVWPH